jgi:predicted secreted protein
MTNALASYSTLLKIGDGGGPEAFTTIAEVKDISGPALALATEDVTSHSSSGAWREFIATLKDAGEVTFTVNFIPTTATQSYTSGLLRDYNNRTKRNFQLVFPDGGSTTWAFPAYVTGFEPDESVEGVLEASISLKIAGAPTLAG